MTTFLFGPFLLLTSLGSSMAITMISSNPYATPCANNVSSAWLDIILLIDTSSNMGDANIKRITTSMASEFSKWSLSTGDVLYTSRVAVITYASYYHVVGYLDTYSTSAQLASALLSIKADMTDNSSAGLCQEQDCVGGAASKVFTWISETETGSYASANRPIVIILYAASTNGINQNDVFNQLLNGRPYVPQVNMIAVNMKPSDAQLTQFLKQNRTKYSYLDGTSKSLYNETNNILLQSNCFDFDIDPYNSEQLIDNKTHIKYADSFKPVDPFGWSGKNPNDLCINFNEINGGPQMVTAAAITSQFKADFADGKVGTNDYSIGLHRNSQGKWMWYDYDSTEFPLGNFTRWAPEFGVNSTGDCVVARYYPGKPHHLWETTQCPIQEENVAPYVMCQYHACDTSFTFWDCSADGEAFMKKQKKQGSKLYREEKKNGVKRVKNQ